MYMFYIQSLLKIIFFYFIFKNLLLWITYTGLMLKQSTVIADVLSSSDIYFAGKNYKSSKHEAC